MMVVLNVFWCKRLSGMSDQQLQKKDCPLCQKEGGSVLFSNELFRVVWADEPLYPGFLRLIWNTHVQEFTDLEPTDQALCMRWVAQLESISRSLFKPDKVNIASLGNVVPHLHWHIVPRYRDDAHFPNPVWGPALREGKLNPMQQLIQESRLKLQSAIEWQLADFAKTGAQPQSV